MMFRRNESSKKLVCGGAAAAAWLLVPLLVLVVLNTDRLPKVRETGITQVSDFFYSIRGRLPLSKDGITSSNQVQYPGATKENVVQADTQVSSSDSESAKLIAKLRAEIARLKAAAGSPKETDSVADASDEIPGDGVDAIKDHDKEFLAMDGKIDGSLRNSDVGAPRSKLSCDLDNGAMSICAMEGDIRMQGKYADVFVVSASNYSWPENKTVTVRPFPRKWEIQTMQKVRAVNIRSSAPVATTDDTAAAPACTVTHDAPAVIFSSGPYSGNFFHAMNDMIIPLYNTAREYDGHVHLVVTDLNPEFTSRYREILAALSVHPVIDFDADVAVRCFPAVRVGIEIHDELRINPALSRKGYTMADFRDFLRSTYSLKNAWATPANRSSGQKPRLVMLLRRHARAITNEAEAIEAAREVGFEVVAAGPEMVRDMARFAQVVSSCNVMVGVHGAGLTNMVFLPNNGTLMQIVPWGAMHDICWHEFGRPAPDMGLRYVEYEVNADETTLKDVYPRDHPVFADPASIHKQGFGKVGELFLIGQKVILDIERFRAAMQEVYQSVTVT
uniref:Uncharacterized protein n=1 Tax=Avena sativa TaxID=4498 RepID=A0ACD5ZW46_AVESA